MLVLRQQIIVLRRAKPGRVPLLAVDRMVLTWICQLFPKARKALAIVQPDTVVRWHRAGFRRYWRWKSGPRRGRPGVPAEVRRLTREISIANPLWGAPRIHGELVKLGIDIGQTSIAKYMARSRGPSSQGWRTFLRNHADGIAAMDLFVVPTVSFRLLYGLLIMGNGRRQILWCGVTAHPTAEWIANQLTAACGWEQVPRYLIRDRDACYGSIFVSRVCSLGIRDHPTSACSPWQNGYADRLDPPGASEPRRGDGRAVPSPYPCVLHGILQCGAYAPLAREGCAQWEEHSASRTYRRTPYPRWTPSSIRPDLICGRDSRSILKEAP